MYPIVLAFYLLTAAYLPPSMTAGQNPLQFVLSLARDTQGDVWAGTEADGVWECSPGGRWRQFTTHNGLSEDSGTAVAVDLQGRVWVGHRKAGVSVFNGRAWKNYDATTGPLGGRVFDIAVCPVDGDVWMATDRGLARWRQARDAWTYLTHAQGVPDDQATALAFAADGTLYEGTQASGIAVGSPADGYQTWRVVPGPERVPNASAGAGLPSPLINVLLAAHSGAIFAGTTGGLAGSFDGGQTWHYLRGEDWKEKAQQQASGTPASLSPAGQPLLSEDYVTSMAEDAAGQLWIGHRQTGVELYDPKTGQHVFLPHLPLFDYVRALIVLDGGTPWIGNYGIGLFAPGPAMAADGAAFAPLPSPASAPDAGMLAALTQNVMARSIPSAMAAGALPAVAAGAFLGDDWATQGDWLGRYGHQYAILYGTENSHAPVTAAPSYNVQIGIGPHHKDYGGVYTYVSRLYTDDPRILYEPARATRRDSEVNDGSFDHVKYPLTYDGPDLWLTVQVPSGAHRISLYFVNDDGHFVNVGGIGDNRLRDYTLELMSGTAENPGELLAHTRVFDFYDGVYKQFVVQGPGPFAIRVGRNNSFVTKLQGVFIDRLSEASSAGADPALTVHAYGPPSAALPPDSTPTLIAANALWTALDLADENGAVPDVADRVLAYRAAAAEGAPAALLTNWRWALRLWTPQDRADFTGAVAWRPAPTAH